MKSFLQILLISFLCYACSAPYYLCTTSTETSLYSKNKEKGSLLVSIPAETEIKVKGHAKYQKINYKEYIGWIDTSNLIYPNTKLYSSKDTNSRTTSIRTTNSSGTVQVKGYYRKDGTYVRPHTRSKPKTSYKRKKY
tara:strand:- start:1247 stop:1657 length:411 start_codon:yes stop_codon:yes gene_type:complete